MRLGSLSDAIADFIGRILFPRTERAVRRRHLRFLALSILFGLLFCLVFGFLLLVLNKQNRFDAP